MADCITGLGQGSAEERVALMSLAALVHRVPSSIPPIAGKRLFAPQAFVVCFVQNSTVRERNDSNAIPSPPTRSFR